MKKYILFILICVTNMSCEFYTSGNGDLDGFWQLRLLDSLKTGKSVDMRESGVYWGVQTDLLETSTRNIMVLFRFNLVGDSLFLREPYINNRDVSDMLVTDATLLAPMGVNHINEGFRVIELNGRTMMLQSDLLRLYFRKY